ncbi:unnamed protein product [Orchesella dallaii]|uniref:C2H2-type domain-containing protein n=1 Tax=Orchesella dallaii TaxID=48710 RepID=A0ABP1R2M8_9HEXA
MSVEFIDEPTLACQHCDKVFKVRIDLRRHQQVHGAQHQDHNANVDTQETHVNVIIHDIADKKLQIQVTSEAIACPKADTQDPVPDFGKLANNVIWIDSQGFSTINDVDWSLLGDQKKQPGAVVTDSLA